jgi:ketosteroid isomerase-like protein
MSEENVEAFKRAYAAGTRYDAEAFIAEMHPDVEWHAGLLASLAGEQSAVVRGHDGIRGLIQDFEEVFAESHMEFPDIRDVGDRVVALGVFRNRGKTSGAEIESPIAYVVEFKDGKIIYIRTYFDHRQALEAAGLSE